VALVVAAAPLGRAQAEPSKPPPAVRLVYDRGPSAADCPDEQMVVYAVRARLGFDPFHEPADLVIRASLFRIGEELRATIRLSDNRRNQGERNLVSRRSDCTELASAVELALSIAVDPLSVARDAPAPASAPAPIVVGQAAPPAAPAPPAAVSVQAAPPAPPKHVQATLGAAGSVGGSVAPTLGVVAGVGFGTDSWSVAIEGRADLPASKEVDGGGRITASMLAGTLAPCFQRWLLGGCLLATVAALRGAGEGLDAPREQTTWLVAGGARVLIEAPGSGWVAFRAHLDLLSPLVRTTLKVGGNPVWTAPPISAALGVAAVVRFR